MLGRLTDALRRLLRTGLGGLLAVAIMIGASVVLWLGTPLLWLWVGSQVQGATDSLSLSLAVMFTGVLVSVVLLGWLLATLSRAHRAGVVAQGRPDPGHRMLEVVLVLSAAVVVAVFAVWFFLLAGAAPIPIGLNL